MEPINILRGYGKVNSNFEDATFIRPPQRKPLITTLAIFAILLLTLVISLMLAALIYESVTESPESPFLSSSDSIRVVCNVTRYPNSCFTSISSLNTPTKPDPEAIFNLSLQLSLRELSKLSSLLQTCNCTGIDDCVTQFDDALGRLNDSVLAMKVAPGEKVLTDEKVNNIKTWISAAMTDQETCLDGLSEMGSTVIDEFKAEMERATEFMSNSLAIIANMQILLEKFGLKMY
ncbi:hypothetical protein K2173_019710 [Erythroxylum novogranatense]|uniref:pectinesterase n=1 Tax=Erythroxylum novogranatense TaxID=1862640 RepID=A0AAV8SM38_9ROSI|nr:hypothetical protein K2173_019710 [Erythroxylum novogranatense]